jgi:hypothetical protein
MSVPPLDVDLDPSKAGLGVLGDVGECLGDGEVDGRLGGRRDAFVRRAQLDGYGRAGDQALERGREAALAQHGRVNSTGEITQLGQGPL